jgi:hypothetical protein
MTYAVFFDRQPPESALGALGAEVWQGKNGDVNIIPFMAYHLPQFVAVRQWWFLRFVDGRNVDAWVSEWRYQFSYHGKTTCFDHELIEVLHLGLGHANLFGIALMTEQVPPMRDGELTYPPVVVKGPSITVETIMDEIGLALKRPAYNLDIFVDRFGPWMGCSGER